MSALGVTAIEQATHLLPNITRRCVDLVARGADPGVLAAELARAIGEFTGTPWTVERTGELEAALARDGASVRRCECCGGAPVAAVVQLLAGPDPLTALCVDCHTDAVAVGLVEGVAR